MVTNIRQRVKLINNVYMWKNTQHTVIETEGKQANTLFKKL